MTYAQRRLRWEMRVAVRTGDALLSSAICPSDNARGCVWLTNCTAALAFDRMMVECTHYEHSVMRLTFGVRNAGVLR